MLGLKFVRPLYIGERLQAGLARLLNREVAIGHGKEANASLSNELEVSASFNDSSPPLFILQSYVQRISKPTVYEGSHCTRQTGGNDGLLRSHSSEFLLEFFGCRLYHDVMLSFSDVTGTCDDGYVVQGDSSSCSVPRSKRSTS